MPCAMVMTKKTRYFLKVRIAVKLGSDVPFSRIQNGLYALQNTRYARIRLQRSYRLAPGSPQVRGKLNAGSFFQTVAGNLGLPLA